MAATPAAEPTVDRRPWLSAVWRRWPTALGIALGVLILSGDDVQDSVTQLVLLLPLEYLLVAKLRRREATWPVVAVLFAVTIVVTVLDVVPLSSVFAGIALVVLVWSVVDRQLFRSGEFQLQAAGMVGFGVLGLIGLAVAPDPARYVVAAAWLCHAGWDFVHLWRDRVVTRTYAEWCAVVDLCVAFGLVFLI